MRQFFAVAFPLVFLLPISSASSMDFDSPDESSFPVLSDDPDQVGMPDLEFEQPELRTNRPFSVGLGLGEVVPGVVTSLVTSHVLDEQQAMELIIGAGNRRSSNQAEGGTSSSNKTLTLLVDGRYLWWLSREFPIEVDAGLSLSRVLGSVSDGEGSSGSYHLYSVGLGAGLGFESVSENGVWFRWTILSGRYVKLFNGHYSGMTSDRMSSVIHDLSGLKLVGVTNLTLGYSW